MKGSPLRDKSHKGRAMEYMPSKSFTNRKNNIDPVAQFSGYLSRSKDRLTKVNECQGRNEPIVLEHELKRRSLSREPHFRFDEAQFVMIEQQIAERRRRIEALESGAPRRNNCEYSRSANDRGYPASAKPLRTKPEPSPVYYESVLPQPEPPHDSPLRPQA